MIGRTAARRLVYVQHSTKARVEFPAPEAKNKSVRTTVSGRSKGTLSTYRVRDVSFGVFHGPNNCVDDKLLMLSRDIEQRWETVLIDGLGWQKKISIWKRD